MGVSPTQNLPVSSRLHRHRFLAVCDCFRWTNLDPNRVGIWDIGHLRRIYDTQDKCLRHVTIAMKDIVHIDVSEYECE